MYDEDILRDMHKQNIRMTEPFNMGEKCTKVIELERIPHKPRRRRQNDIIVSDSKEQMGRNNILVENRTSSQTHSFHLKRVIKILREILEYKIEHDSCHNSTCINFMDIIHFYCNTSYGMTSVATTRRLDLFHAIRVLSPQSYFVLVMGRMIPIPGNLAYDKDIVSLFSMMWSYLLRDEQQVMNWDQYESHGILYISMVYVTEILNKSLLKLGIRYSPTLITTIQQRFQSIVIHTEDGMPPLLDVDHAIFFILAVFEEYDDEAKNMASQLFGVSIIPQRTLSVNARDISMNTNVPLDVVVCESSIMDSLKYLKLLLNAMAARDDQRQGHLLKDVFCDVVVEWYKCSLCGFVDGVATRKIIDELALLFLTTGSLDQQTVANYVDFFCLFHSFVLEYSAIPTLERAKDLMMTPHRGVELNHYEFTMKYVDTVRLEQNGTSSHR